MEIELKAVFWRREGNESCSITRSASFIGSWPTMYGDLKKKTALQEGKILQLLEYDIEVTSVWQGSLLWFSAPTERNNVLRDHINFQEKFDEVTDAALQDAIHSPFRKGWTPRDCFLDATQKNWSTLNAGESLIGNARDGWELGGRAVARAYAKKIVRVHGHLGSRPQDGQTSEFVFSFAKKEKKQSKR